jgi:hypothetical protein
VSLFRWCGLGGPSGELFGKGPKYRISSMQFGPVARPSPGRAFIRVRHIHRQAFPGEHASEPSSRNSHGANCPKKALIGH